MPLLLQKGYVIRVSDDAPLGLLHKPSDNGLPPGYRLERLLEKLGV